MSISSVEIAQIGQYAENVYFGKPCGLMDQSAIALGGVSYIDFEDPTEPKVEKLDWSFNDTTVFVVNCGGDHCNLTPNYAAIREEMESIAKEFGEEKLSPVRLQYEEALTKLKGDIEDVIKQKAEYQEELRRIEDESADLPEDSVEFEALEIQYERVEDNIAAANERFSELRIEYDSYAKELRVYAEDEEFEDLPEEITSPKDFSMFIEKLSEKKAKRAGRREQKREVLEEYQAEKRANLAKEGRGQSGLRAKRQAEEEAKLQGNVGNSEYRSSGEGKSSLRERIIKNLKKKV